MSDSTQDLSLVRKLWDTKTRKPRLSLKSTSKAKFKTIDGNTITGDGDITAGSSASYITGTTTFNFGNEQDSSESTINNANITSTNFRALTIIPQETSSTSVDDFKLNGVSINMGTIVNNTSFTLVANALNNASGVYTVKYSIIYGN